MIWNLLNIKKEKNSSNFFITYVVYTPTNVPFINWGKSFKFTLKYKIISLLHVSVFIDRHHEALYVTD